MSAEIEITDTHGERTKPRYDDVNVPVVFLIGIISAIVTFLTIMFVQGLYYHWQATFTNGSTVRRNKKFMIGASIYLLLLHWIDVYWIIMPQISADMYNLTTTFYFPLVEIVMFLGFAGIFTGSFFLIAGNRSLVPVGDPRISEALHYHNV